MYAWSQYALDLLAHTRKIFSSEPTLQEITIPNDHKLTIVGDVHGQLQDLFTIFTLNGLPTEVSMSEHFMHLLDSCLLMSWYVMITITYSHASYTGIRVSFQW